MKNETSQNSSLIAISQQTSAKSQQTSLPQLTWSPWKFVTWFGVVSGLVDFLYQGVRALSGPFLTSLGANGASVGFITGFGEAFAMAGRLGTGPLADRTKAYWRLATAGYGMTIIASPFIGLTQALWLAALLIIIERAGKAVRSPARDVMLSHAAASIGRGKSFATHKALDQGGAVVGPLLVAAVLSSTHSYAWAFGVLALPGVLALALLIWIQRAVPNPALYEHEHAHTSAATVDIANAQGQHSGQEQHAHAGAPHTQRATFTSQFRAMGKAFWWYVAFAFFSTLGVATFAVIAYHLLHHHLLRNNAIPLVYAVAMLLQGVAAIFAGVLFDRLGRRTLLAVPFFAFFSTTLAFSRSLTLVFCGIALWSIIEGVQESTMRATVAELVPRYFRGSAFGLFAAVFGIATFAGATLIGALYEYSFRALLVGVGTTECCAVICFVLHFRHLTPLLSSTEDATA